MALRSLFVLGAALSSLVSAQTALPAVSADGAEQCGGCFLVADVAGILFGGVQTQTATNIVSVGTGRNGSLSTTTIQSVGKVTFVSDAPVPGALPTSFNPFGSTIVVGGATLTSPTSYEVFTAYSVTRTISGPNGCTVVSSSPVILPTGMTFAIPEGAGESFLLEAESSFITAVGFPSCSAGGGNVQSTIHSMLTTATEQVTTTGLSRPTPAAISVVPTSTSVSHSMAPATTILIANATASGPSATFTVVPFLGAGSRPVPAWATWAGVALCGAVLGWM